MVNGEEAARIGPGLLVLLGAEKGDDEAAAVWLAEKILTLRIFADAAGKMNLSVQDIAGEILVVSQFTLAGDCRRGRRPGFDRAAAPGDAARLYRRFITAAARTGLVVREGRFGEHMQVKIDNDGPVTFVLER
ncbi:MAG: D-aminoacyl-tRNA deacylase [Nitrospinaceae bacterium]